MPSFEFRDGEMIEIPDLTITESKALTENVNTSVVLTPGVTVLAAGVINGSVSIASEATLTVTGTLNGSTHIADGGTVEIRGTHNGTTSVHRGGTLIIQPEGSSNGTIKVEGRMVNFGLRAGAVVGSGLIQDMTGSTVRQPDEIRPDGTRIYRS